MVERDMVGVRFCGVPENLRGLKDCPQKLFLRILVELDWKKLSRDEQG